MTIIAVDFDGTLCENRWPEIGEAREDVILELLKRQQAGARLILWTCRVDRRLDEAVKWCAARGIWFAAVNENLPEMTAMFGNDCRKVYADEYWDDRNVFVPRTGGPVYLDGAVVVRRGGNARAKKPWYIRLHERLSGKV